MTKKQLNGSTSYTDALLISQSLAELTAYALIGDQILMPGGDDNSSSNSRSLVLMPGVSLASEEMQRGIAMLRTSALGVRCLLMSDGERLPDFTVLFADKGKAERFACLRPWLGRDGDVYLIPDESMDESDAACFKFDRGLRKALQPWADDADRRRGIAEASVLLLVQGADTGPADTRKN